MVGKPSNSEHSIGLASHPQLQLHSDRGQTKGLTRAEGWRGGAQAEAGNGEEFKGGKRLRDREGRTALGTRPRGAESPGRAKRCTGTGVAGGGDGANAGQEKQNKKQNSYDFRESSHENEWSAEEEGQGSESDCVGGRSRDSVGHTDLEGVNVEVFAAP